MSFEFRDASANPRTVSYASDPSDHEAQAERVRQQASRAYVSNGLGDPPPRNQGEPLPVFRRRLLEPLRGFSPAWRGVDAATVQKLSGDDRAFRNVEAQVYADAEVRGLHHYAPGELREIREKDLTGRTIVHFVGDPAATWAPFRLSARNVIGFGSK
jgi:hypothetical protein